MSENPYSTPPSLDYGNPGYQQLPYKEPVPTPLIILCIMCIVFAAGGLVGTCFGVIGFVAQDTLQKFTLQAAPPEQRELQKKINEVQAGYIIPNVMLLAANAIIAPLLLAGSIGGLMRKPWARQLLAYALVAAAIFITVRFVFGGIMQYNLMSVMEQQANGPPQMAAAMQIGFVVGLAVGGLIFLAMLAFYMWGAIYLGRSNIKAHFSQSPLSSE